MFLYVYLLTLLLPHLESNFYCFFSFLFFLFRGGLRPHTHAHVFDQASSFCVSRNTRERSNEINSTVLMFSFSGGERLYVSQRSNRRRIHPFAGVFNICTRVDKMWHERVWLPSQRPGDDENTQSPPDQGTLSSDWKINHSNLHFDSTLKTFSHRLSFKSLIFQLHVALTSG